MTPTRRRRDRDEVLTGIEVSLRFGSNCAVDPAGVVRYENKVAAEGAVIVAGLRRCSAAVTQGGLEAGTLTQYMTYGLQKAGCESFTDAGSILRIYVELMEELGSGRRAPWKL